MADPAHRSDPSRRLRGLAGGGSIAKIDPLIHERVRLGIVSALAAQGTMSFQELRDLLELTDGNLAVHARKLEDAGYVACDKGFVGRVPRTQYRLTPLGREALAEYVRHMESLLRSARRGRGS